ncbi:cytochrome c oxidase assembly factor Coa1 family protein [Gramella sp. MAR_2010_147]|uniref:cytochrome c oxidase assembly factor Coa1 family protein n=1 Tax=Gramella sp. MAR_2010_147 TaxID=1250205 RepID=UPI00087A9424|nr:cytochrome c oxidase assembly factor Coa1 family protein [Gramella sp. MAR_2010_147]SDS28978.1 Cytochrome oxidase complex assembly protein 1 [Gramella sp. MAR_2010_147]
MKRPWINRNYKWLVPVVCIITIILYLFTSSGLGKIATDLTQAYADNDLYKNAIENANKDQRVLKSIGFIKPIDKMVILNGEVRYSENNQKVSTTIKINGEKGDAKLDIEAYRIDEKWHYDQINVRIFNSSEYTQTIETIKP